VEEWWRGFLPEELEQYRGAVVGGIIGGWIGRLFGSDAGEDAVEELQK
jgi:uncharacterized protein YcfJ